MYLALDIGGTKTQIGLYRQLYPESLVDSLTLSTPSRFPAFQTQLSQQLNQWNLASLEGIGVSLAAKVNLDGSIGISANLLDYQHQPLQSWLSHTYQTPVKLKNDALAAASAEIIWGGKPKVNRLLHLVLGTGFGGGFVFRSAASLHEVPLEPSRIVVQKNGRSHHSLPLKGQLGAYISAKSIHHFYHQDPVHLSDDDPVWQEVAEYLALGIYNLSVLLNPEKITFSGGLISRRSFLLSLTADHLHAYQAVLSPPPLAMTSLTSNPCLVGALTSFL